MNDSTIFRPIIEGKIFVYKIGDDGTVIKCSKKLYRESKSTPYAKRGKMAVKINRKEYILKHLVAKAFIDGYKKGLSVTHKDGNFKNCAVDNLVVFTKEELGKLTGGDSKRKPVIANGNEYYSVRDCAKSLNCSYQTLLDYLSGKVKNSVLSGVDVKYAEVRE